ncbi:GNAT family N-acetyltransferase [Paenibacillus mesophilus]|uniref:GNAT family N-acetyltransferase n=1 Tax=Paenibacillus mesophilus TaxID=2582849 RepID=UPI00110F3336|nr:GNAT family N-acetyltransferase [Paenibacillus mesophilus]TMV43982.1 GNAT family N-acetyltransferase [Paenibacillus mesophilus]
MSAPFTISKLKRSDRPMFVSLMSRAFARDPLFLHVFGDSDRDAKARKEVEAFVSFMFDKSLKLHEEAWGLFDQDRLLGAYIVEKPAAGRLRKMLEGFWLGGRLISLLFHISGKALNQLNSYMGVTRAAAPRLPHHYLIMIGVKPEAQGKGIGKALLQHLLDSAASDPGSHGIALDTEHLPNVDLYRKFGFALSAETQVDLLPVYCMFCPKK